jgi:eukaryotic-like serine/threonine-protein kinase
MDDAAARWQRIKNKFTEGLELEGAARAVWLEQLQAEDTELWQEVASLLAAHGHADAVLDHVAADFLQEAPGDEPAERWFGRRIGAYVVVDLLGRGGMGEVYRARRADAQYEKEVAIKLVRAGYDTAYVLERFKIERQILADLDHPNIARLLDGGATDEGLPYLVMELVAGEPIDVYCDRARLALRARLQLFRRVCEAVQFAHQRLVIHRDLKTGNMLVTPDGVPKLLDFGVAKLLRTATAATETTLLHPLTPAYASPEQLRGEPLTTASDIYSLGVVLYELLSGYSPFRASSGARERSGAGRGEPRRPSTVLSRRAAAAISAPELERSCAARASTPARLRRLLTGDLDAIVMKAMRPEPQQRYGSVQQLAEDIDRYLQGAAVDAHRGSWRYRAGKFARRNKAAVAAVAATMSALAIGLVMSNHQAHVARAARARADARFEDVRKLANALIFDVNSAMADTPGNTAARKLLLDRAVQYLDKLAQDAAGNTNLQRELAWGYQKLAAVQGNTTQSNVGEISAADRSLHKAIGLFEAVFRANPASLDDGLTLAMSHRMMGASDIYYPGGRPQIERAVQITTQLERTHKGDARLEAERCREYDLLGYSLDLGGDRLGAVASIREALRLAQALQQADASSERAETVARITVHLGGQLRHVGALQEAEATLAAGVQQYDSLQQSGKTLELTRNTAHARMLLGQSNMLRGHLAEAERNFTDASATVVRLLQQDPGNAMLTWDVVSLAFDQGRLLCISGHAERAPASFQPVLDQYAKDTEDDSGPGAGLVHAWVAQVHQQAGRYAEAVRELHASIDGLKAGPAYADGRTGLAADQVMIGDMLLRLRDYAGAQAAYQEVLSGANVPEALTHGDMATLYAVAGAQAGTGDVLTALARGRPDAQGRAQQLLQACTYYSASDKTWSQIHEPGLYSPDEYPSASPQALRARLAACHRPHAVAAR